METVPNIRLRNFDEVRAALTNQDLARSLDYERFEKGNVEEGTVCIIHGEEHRQRRRVENALFRRQTLEFYEGELFPDIVSHTLEKFVSTDRADLLEVGGLITVVLSCRTAGIDLTRDSLAERQRLRRYLHDFALGGAIDAAKGDVDEIKTQMRQTTDEFFSEFMSPSWQRRTDLLEAVGSHKGDEGTLPADILTLLLRSRDEGELEMDDPLLQREVITYFTAGAHTSAQTITNTLHLLFAWRSSHPREWDVHRGDQYFIQRAVQEALRCRPTNPLIHRRALVDTEVASRKIPAGTVVLLDTVAANSDISVWGLDAGDFDPLRIHPDGVSPFGVSFGDGMHICIGRTMAVGTPVRAISERPGDNHLYGLVPLAVHALLERGVSPDPEQPPQRDERTERWTRWAKYPVIFNNAPPH